MALELLSKLGKDEKQQDVDVSDLYQGEKLENFFGHCMLLWTICYVKATLLLRKRKW